MSSIIHTFLTSNGIQFFPIELPPSPPHSPKKSNFLLYPNLLSLPPTSTSSSYTFTPQVWSPSWHAVRHAMTTYSHYYHDIVSMDDNNDIIPSFITNVLNPWFQNNTLQQQKVTPKEWNAYVELNEKLADQIIKRYRSHQDIIWIHDYQLLLLPSLLRYKLPQATIGLSIYGSCPNLENLGVHGRTLHRSMLAADLIGVQSEFNMPTLSATTTTTFLQPTVHLKATSFAAKERSRDIRRLFMNKRIILCQDTEPTGVLKTLSAIEHYLSTLQKQQQQQIMDQVTFIHICTHASIPQSLDSIPDLVRQINQLYGTPQSVPIHFYHQDLDVDEYDALLSAADVALMMGSHPHASIAAQTFIARRRSTTTPLIVSHGSPLLSSSSNVIAADQSNPKSLASTLAYALLEENQTIAPASLKQQPSFLEKLVQKQQNHQTILLNPTQLNEAYRSAKQRLFLFDYDGTLTPIVSNPDDARPSRALLRYLQALCHDPANVVWIVSGRDQATLESWIGSSVQGIGLSAEHGSFMKLPGEGSIWVDMLATADMGWQSTALEIFESFTAQTPGTVVEQKKASITWHYRNAHDSDFALKQVEACFEQLQKISGVDILRGKMNLEVRSLLVNKGNVVQRIQQSVGADFVLCAGDDRTDEDMFRALKKEPAYCVLIGPQDKETEARYSVPTSEQFVASVGQLAAISSNTQSTL
ncbi:trehalose-phosphatase-domain-containing protein [Phascolomyces articulosus]|uniref:Trehalose-phosphatase-domain-containing protein n=1 Tax=Phascolomyces articulosus TaxID=60185 RepID=A0AAD5PFC4_9FUNG|nr:trehalose-phosphatase-domain-containing protein [Phascolomyces articulosus]